MSETSKKTQAIVENHLAEFYRGSVDGVLRDYTEDSVLMVPTGPLRGLREIRGFFTTLINTLPDGFLKAFKLQRQDFVGETGYIVWDAAPWVNLATDTFIVRNGKIMIQSFAAYPPSW